MDENPQSAQNPNLEKSNSEFAEKGPLVNPETVRKFLRITFLIVGIIAVLIGLVIAYQILTTPQTDPIIEDPVVQEPVNNNPIAADKSYFAYIKNEKNIWISDTDSQEKFSVVEIPIDSASRVTSLKWRDSTNLGHSVCSNNFCEILVYNFETRSISPVLSTQNAIRSFAWSPNQEYFGYIENAENTTNLRIKSGTIDNVVKSFPAAIDVTQTKVDVLFTTDNRYVIFYTVRQRDPQFDERGQPISDTNPPFPAIYAFQVNGVQVDEILNASDPFLINGETLAYKINNQLVYKTIGSVGESLITPFQGYNPTISFDNRNIAYWRDEVGFNTVVLGVYDSELDVHRNILRGIILPTWISPSRVAGIQADSCLGDRCLLYQFQTASLVIVDITAGEVISVDQGQSISDVVYYAD